MNNSDKLVEFYNNEYQSQLDYTEHIDFIGGYAECMYHGGVDHYRGEMDDDIKYLVKHLDDDQFILEHCEAVKTCGIHRVSNEICSMNLGEIELQLDEEKLKELTKNMSKEEIKECQDKSEGYIDGGYLYIDCSYDRVSLILNEESLLNALK